MLFNSIEFAVFLPVVFVLYWYVFKRNLTAQNLFLIGASYVFYGWWDWRFLALIIISSLVDYIVGLGLGVYPKNPSGINKRRILLLISIFVNLGFLGFFKYFNFFSENFAQAFTLFGSRFEPTQLRIILPVGISFYTFQTLSYSIDVYRQKLEPTKDIFAFFAFVSFFPQLVAGPIERATHLLPQFYGKRTFVYRDAADGMRQILWGLFKKIVIADQCAVAVNAIFKNYDTFSGSTLIAGAVLFAFQIYGDFSGYSDIAIGTSRLFGFHLMRNFAYPYFSRDIAEFWRRWHISLSTWFRDYLYIPLGGSRGSAWIKIRNIFVIFLVSGLWHGANWTFVVWGAVNACCFLPLILSGKHRNHMETIKAGKILPDFGECIQILMTFALTTTAWIFFRAENLHHAFSYLYRIVATSFLPLPTIISNKIFVFCGVLIIIEWLQRDRQHALQIESFRLPGCIRWGFYYAVIFLIWWHSGNAQSFIYFQF